MIKGKSDKAVEIINESYKRKLTSSEVSFLMRQPKVLATMICCMLFYACMLWMVGWLNFITGTIILSLPVIIYCMLKYRDPQHSGKYAKTLVKWMDKVEMESPSRKAYRNRWSYRLALIRYFAKEVTRLIGSTFRRWFR